MRKTCNKLIAIILLVCVMVTTGITCSFAATEMNSDTVELAKEQRLISTYLSTRGYSVDMWVGNMPRKSKIVQQLEQGHPVIYVDQFDNPAGGDAVDHDIVIYGYDDENNLIAHFGWEGYAHVQATSDALAAFISSACAISSW